MITYIFTSFREVLKSIAKKDRRDQVGFFERLPIEEFVMMLITSSKSLGGIKNKLIKPLILQAASNILLVYECFILF